MEEVKAQTLLWKAPGFAYQVTFPSTLLDQIRSEAVEGFYAVPRGGIEIGGVLFGVIRKEKLEIQAQRQIKSEYKTGPSFVLSSKDKETLHSILLLPFSDPELSGLCALGWYHSHTRSGILFSDIDLELHREFFPDRRQIALVLRPFHLKPTRAGFFFPDSSGCMQCDFSSQDLVLEPPGYGLTLLDQDGAEIPPQIAAPAVLAPEIAGAGSAEANGNGDKRSDASGAGTESGPDATGTVQQNLRLLHQLVTSVPNGTQENGAVSKPEMHQPLSESTGTGAQPGARASESIRSRPIRSRRTRQSKSNRRNRPIRRLNILGRSIRQEQRSAAAPEKNTEPDQRLPAQGFKAEGTGTSVVRPNVEARPAESRLETPPSKEKQPGRFSWKAVLGRLRRYLFAPQEFSKDRRIARREPGDRLLAYYWEGAMSRPKKIRNISRRGAFIETDWQWPSGTRMMLTLEIDKKQKSVDSVHDGIAIDAVVSRLANDGMGLEFIVPDAGRKQWATFLARWKPFEFPIPPVSKTRSEK